MNLKYLFIPHMMPMNWLILYLYFNLMFLMFMIMLYYLFIYNKMINKMILNNLYKIYKMLW